MHTKSRICPCPDCYRERLAYPARSDALSLRIANEYELFDNSGMPLDPETVSVFVSQLNLNSERAT